MWSWDICADTCAICRNSLNEPSIEYQANPSPNNENGLSIAFGCCGHARPPGLDVSSVPRARAVGVGHSWHPEVFCAGDDASAVNVLTSDVRSVKPPRASSPRRGLLGAARRERLRLDAVADRAVVDERARTVRVDAGVTLRDLLDFLAAFVGKVEDDTVVQPELLERELRWALARRPAGAQRTWLGWYSLFQISLHRWDARIAARWPRQSSPLVGGWCQEGVKAWHKEYVRCHESWPNATVAPFASGGIDVRSWARPLFVARVPAAVE